LVGGLLEPVDDSVEVGWHVGKYDIGLDASEQHCKNLSWTMN
jgi:hypothetical protein